MPTGSLQHAKAPLVRERVVAGYAQLLADGAEPTFAKVAQAAGALERTVYRHFPSRKALLAAVLDWANDRTGFDGRLPADSAGHAELARAAFPGFDEIEPVVNELLVAPDARDARFGRNAERREAALATVRREVPGLDATTTRQAAAMLQLLTTAGIWRSLRDHWDVDGAEAAEIAATAVDLLLAGARAHADAEGPSR